jgi:hypothetical protein
MVFIYKMTYKLWTVSLICDTKKWGFWSYLILLVEWSHGIDIIPIYEMAYQIKFFQMYLTFKKL